MTIETIEFKKLKADEGMVLTDGEDYSSVGGEVCIGVLDSADRWHEITEAEYNEIMAEKNNSKMSDINLNSDSNTI